VIFRVSSHIRDKGRQTYRVRSTLLRANLQMPSITLGKTHIASEFITIRRPFESNYRPELPMQD
jgi:hypothetical protein